MTDAHYTSADVAKELLALAPEKIPVRVADFACGDGALLAAALERWPQAEFYAVDINQEVEQAVQERVGQVSFACADFLSDGAISAIPWLEDELFDLIVLNPPFTCKGSTVFTEEIDGTELKCSKAMAFIVRCLGYLSDEGTLAAILPSSCLTSQKDKSASAIIDRRYELQQVHPVTSPKFRNCAVDTVMVRIGPRKQGFIVAGTEVRQSQIHVPLNVVRGRRPNEHDACVSGATFPFVHTTEMHDRRVVSHRRLPPALSDRLISGPAILLARVGRPSLEKVCWLEPGRTINISDCVIAIWSEDECLLAALKDDLNIRWDEFSKLYVGSCAKYLTMDRLNRFLQSWWHSTKRSYRRTQLSAVRSTNISSG